MSHSKKFFKEHPNHPCVEGIGECCKDTGFPITKPEARRLYRHIQTLSKKKREEIVNRAREVQKRSHDDCPLLENGRCISYKHRPITCIWAGAAMSVSTNELAVLKKQESLPIKGRTTPMCEDCYNTLADRGVEIPCDSLRASKNFSEWIIPRMYNSVAGAILDEFDR